LLLFSLKSLQNSIYLNLDTVPNTLCKLFLTMQVADEADNVVNTTFTMVVTVIKNIVTIKLPSVSYENHGVYKCIAKNFKGQAVKTFRVIVIGNERIWKTTSLLT